MGWHHVIPLLSSDKRLMNKNLRKLLLLLTTLLPLTACGGSDDNGNSPDSNTPKSATLKNYTPARVLAFPGADGGASTIATGGAERDVYIVTSLADDNQPGTLRAAISSGKRTIVFAIAGKIDLQSRLNINKSDITIAGQSAPGDGITIAGYPVYISGSNIILRYLRFRMGDQNIDKSNFDADDGDALGGKGGKNIIIDHCSVSWSTDECASFSTNALPSHVLRTSPCSTASSLRVLNFRGIAKGTTAMVASGVAETQPTTITCWHTTTHVTHASTTNMSAMSFLDQSTILIM